MSDGSQQPASHDQELADAGLAALVAVRPPRAALDLVADFDLGLVLGLVLDLVLAFDLTGMGGVMLSTLYCGGRRYAK